MAKRKSTWDLRDPEVMHDILNLCSDTEVHICPGCVKHQQDACPYRGEEPVGICKGYVHAEKDPAVEARVHEHILVNAERIALKSKAQPSPATAAAQA